MFHRIPIKESFEHSRGLEIEKRLRSERVGSSVVLTAVDFDSSKLDLGHYELYDLTNMLTAGVKPGKAVPHDLPLIDAVESANAYAAIVEQSEVITNS